MHNITSSERTRRLIDNAERVVVAAFFAALCYRFAATLGEKPSNLIFLFSEGIVALFVLLRRSTDQLSMRPADWLVAFVGTMLPFLLLPAEGGWPGAIGLMIVGFLISVGAKLSLRRSFGVVAANRGVQTRGLYAAVRHPMYLGYFITNTGMLLLNPSIWNAFLIFAWGACQIGRIHAEERILFQDTAYRSLAERVRFRLLPLIY